MQCVIVFVVIVIYMCTSLQRNGDAEYAQNLLVIIYIIYFVILNTLSPKMHDIISLNLQEI